MRVVQGAAGRFLLRRFEIKATVPIVPSLHCLSRCLFRGPVGRVNTACGRRCLMGRGFQRPSPPLPVPREAFRPVGSVGPAMSNTFKWGVIDIFLAYGRSALCEVTVAWAPPLLQHFIWRSFGYGSDGNGCGGNGCGVLLLCWRFVLCGVGFVLLCTVRWSVRCSQLTGPTHLSHGRCRITQWRQQS